MGNEKREDGEPIPVKDPTEGYIPGAGEAEERSDETTPAEDLDETDEDDLDETDEDDEDDLDETDEEDLDGEEGGEEAVSA